MRTDFEQLKSLLDEKVDAYNRWSFIESDPICIPHLFTKNQDIEIAGLFAAVLAWGQRKTIINKSLELMQMMDNSPHDFVQNHSEDDLKPLTRFVHRTFNATDLLYFIHWLRHHYQSHNSLEHAFFVSGLDKMQDTEYALSFFYRQFFSLADAPHRTRKHLQTPENKSACKRMNMFLRWMVRKDDRGVDFGIWSNIKPHQLICPCDLHVDRVARQLGLITRKQTDWLTARELTENLRKFDPSDPVKYDFALFGMGIMEK